VRSEERRNRRARFWEFDSGLDLDKVPSEQYVEAGRLSAAYASRHPLVLGTFCVWLVTAGALIYFEAPWAYLAAPVGLVVLVMLRRRLMNRFIRDRYLNVA
jgi:hypothetical protein